MLTQIESWYGLSSVHKHFAAAFTLLNVHENAHRIVSEQCHLSPCPSMWTLFHDLENVFAVLCNCFLCAHNCHNIRKGNTKTAPTSTHLWCLGCEGIVTESPETVVGKSLRAIAKSCHITSIVRRGLKIVSSTTYITARRTAWNRHETSVNECISAIIASMLDPCLLVPSCVYQRTASLGHLVSPQLCWKCLPSPCLGWPSYLPLWGCL